MAGRGAQGTRILHSADGLAYLDVEAVNNISGPNGQAANIDVTDLRSTGKENIPGLADYGTLTLDINYTDADEQVALFDMFSSHADPEAFRLAFPEDSTGATYVTYDFLASVSGCVFGAKVDDKQTMQITLKTSGGMTRESAVDAADLLMGGTLLSQEFAKSKKDKKDKAEKAKAARAEASAKRAEAQQQQAA